jgi:hypothetical protein
MNHWRISTEFALSLFNPYLPAHVQVAAMEKDSSSATSAAACIACSTQDSGPDRLAS